MGIAIRRFRKEDALKVSNVTKRSQLITLKNHYPKKLLVFYCKKNTPKKVIERAKKQKTFVAAEGKKILGVASLSGNEIGTLYVDPIHQKKGVGKKLFERVKKEVQKQGHKKLKVGSSLYAINFYKKLGFKVVRKQHKEDMGVRYYNVLMEQNIK